MSQRDGTTPIGPLFDARTGTHELRCWPGYWADVARGVKNFEVRPDDRTPMFRVGHRLRLREWDEHNGYSGREITKRITYVLAGDQFGIEKGYCVMGFRDA